MTHMVMLLLAAVAAVTAEELVAVVRLVPHDMAKQNVNGELTITQSVANGPVKLTGKISGLKPDSLHGFHVHEKGDVSSGCLSTGGHFNPDNVTHGAPEDTVRHVGDLGNVMSNTEGVAMVDITDNVISLSGPNSILGRAFVVHSGEDDLGKGNSSLSLTTGNAGDRWACGIVGVLSPTGRWSNAASLATYSTPLMLVSAIAALQQLRY